ncbi:MAG TPA: ABC transporter permease [Thermomicrobiales bacterium]|jgi:simple sugar transport system permease protein
MTGQAATAGHGPAQQLWSLARRAGRAALVPALAIFTALLLGALIIWATTGSLATALAAYGGLWEGALGSPKAIAGTLVRATPYVFTGLAVALAFKCGLFNIGAEGQLALGAVCAAWVGYRFQLPGLLHIPLTILAGIVGGFLWGMVPGILKARTGAHEVITTIMMNYLALQIVQILLSGPMKDPRTVASQTPVLQQTSWLPMLIPALQLHSGVLLAVLMTIAVWWFFARTIWGFELRTVGTNPAAARYAGMPVIRNVIMAMALSGALAGLAGAVEVAGVALDVTTVTPAGTRYFGLGFSSGYGFDSIAVALLARGNPFGVIGAALLFGGLRAGATRMQFNTQVPGEIISVIQALILLLIAADVIVRRLYRLRAATADEAQPALTSGWGEKVA